MINWFKLAAGILILSGMVVFFSSGYTPPGICGEVLRHNQQYDIDASPIFYSEVENMTDYERGVLEMRERARLKEYRVIELQTP